MRRRLILLLALGLVAGGLWRLGGAGYIEAKALLAQVLLRHAWADTLAGDRQVRPWPWADTWPVARLTTADGAADLIVLAGASGRTLAFGPGLHDGGARPNDPGRVLLGGHRDTHFRFLRDLKPDDRLYLTSPDGLRVTYRVVERRITHVDRARLDMHPGGRVLTLVTCWPFDALRPGGPMRYLVTAVETPDPLARTTLRQADSKAIKTGTNDG
ncbi:MAG: class GN sortase [Rhodobacterales bacterium]|nr:class GN sortase [Rhodobacterales bacterium]